MLQLHWIKTTEGNWMSLDNVVLDKVTAQGVYIIWHDGETGRVVRVGQGDIRARLLAHRSDTAITSHRRKGTLRVTWASVPAAQMDGVETHLADQWSPLVRGASPDCEPIAVNCPW
jgi:hypothetical protein